MFNTFSCSGFKKSKALKQLPNFSKLRVDKFLFGNVHIFWVIKKIFFHHCSQLTQTYSITGNVLTTCYQKIVLKIVYRKFFTTIPLFYNNVSRIGIYVIFLNLMPYAFDKNLKNVLMKTKFQSLQILLVLQQLKVLYICYL